MKKRCRCDLVTHGPCWDHTQALPEELSLALQLWPWKEHGNVSCARLCQALDAHWLISLSQPPARQLYPHFPEVQKEGVAC